MSAAHDHDHDHAPASFGRAFAIGIALQTAFIVAEIIVGLSAHSLAVLSDAGHKRQRCARARTRVGCHQAGAPQGDQGADLWIEEREHRRELDGKLRAEFKVHHVTLQIDPEGSACSLATDHAI